MGLLSSYKKKRNLKKSGEPKAVVRNQASGIANRESGRNLFVIQEHNASHLHWDFRLAMNGVLKSWALPKVPPKRKGIKRLAIQVEDHPMSYLKFEGKIKSGYGKGDVKIWDKGTYELIEKDSKKIEVELHGKKLKGKYVLVNAKLRENKKNWLFMKI